MFFMSWNCNMAFRNKVNKIPSGLDLFIILESENPSNYPSLSQYNTIWRGENESKGVGIYSKKSFDLTIHELYNPNYRYVIPIEIKKPVKLIIIAIWAMNNKNDVRRRYIGEVFLALTYYKQLLNNQCIIAGDFNWNLKWDNNPHYPLYGKFQEVKELLEAFKIKSTYHWIQNESFGKESKSTFYMYRNQERSYHTDYIFASESLLHLLKSFSIGSYNRWSMHSDHMPIFANFSL